MRLAILLSLMCMVIVNDVMAQQRYVTDEIVITLRTGPSTQNAIIRNLNSGAALTILEENDEGNYARVRLNDGTEGWVLTQYLQNDMTGDQLNAAAERNLAAAREQIEELQAQVEQLSGDLTTATSELGTLRSSEEDLSTELADIRQVSASAIELRDQNESLRRRVNDLDAEVDVITMENDQLRSRDNQNWFIIGAAVLFGGIIIGLVAPSLRPKKRSSW